MDKSSLYEDRLKRIRALDYDYSSQPKQEIQACNLCGATVLTRLTHTDRYGYDASASACSVCGLAFLNPVMTGNAYGSFYADIYRPLVSAYHGRLIDSQTIQDEQSEYAKALTGFVRPWFKKSEGATLLDIGGSTGVVARELADVFAIKAAVLDPAAAELKWAVSSGMEIIPGFIEDYDPKGRQFDLITLCQTIDHLSDASGSLRKIQKLLKSDGLFFVDIVDFRAANLRQESIEGAVKIDHPYYFTEESVEVLLSRTGFKVLQKNYAADHLHIGYMCGVTTADPNALPKPESVRDFFRELRFVQNARR